MTTESVILDFLTGLWIRSGMRTKLPPLPLPQRQPRHSPLQVLNTGKTLNDNLAIIESPLQVSKRRMARLRQAAAKRSTAYARLATVPPSTPPRPFRTESACARARSVREGERAGRGWRIRHNVCERRDERRRHGVRLARYAQGASTHACPRGWRRRSSS